MGARVGIVGGGVWGISGFLGLVGMMGWWFGIGFWLKSSSPSLLSGRMFLPCPGQAGSGDFPRGQLN